MLVQLLLDENLSERLILALAPNFANTRHVRLLGLGGAPDAQIWTQARADGAVLVTKDDDFVALSVLYGPPPKVLWLNIGNASTRETAALVLAHEEAIAQFVAHPDAGFLALGFGPRPG